MEQQKFRSLVKFYLSCIDAEQAVQLKLRKNQEYQAYIFIGKSDKERLFLESLAQLDISLRDAQEKKFIQQRSTDDESLADLYYGYPVFKDDRDMLSPLFLIEVEASFINNQELRLLPKLKSFSLNRAHFLTRYDIEEIQEICDELEGEFGSFDARMKAATKYLPAETEKNTLLDAPILFRAGKGGAKDKMRYELAELLKNGDVVAGQTALKFYLEGNKAVSEAQIQRRPISILEAGMLNKQQEDAVRKGLECPLTVVTGPPGTGKTQVVTALIASAVYNGQTVLFSSNNNMPVDGVYQRLGLSMQRLGNWAMRLGNQDKVSECQRSITALLDGVNQFEFIPQELDQEIEKFQNIEFKIGQVLSGLEKARLLQEKIGALSLRETDVLSKLPRDWEEQFDKGDPRSLNAKKIRQFRWLNAPGLGPWLCRKLCGLEGFREKNNALINAIFADNPGLPGLLGVVLLDESWESTLKKVQKIAGYLSLHQIWSTCISQRRQLEVKIAQLPTNLDLREFKTEKVAASQKLTDLKWQRKIYGYQKDAVDAATGYFKDVGDLSKGRFKRLRKSLDALMRFFPIWITTNQSVNNALPLQPALFDLVIIDKSGQCDIPSVLPLLYRAKRAVFIGDPEQFRHITSLKDNIEFDLAKAANVQDIIEDWSFIRRSAFDRALASSHYATFLSQHYRCHPDIIEFSNDSFYGGKLVTQTLLNRPEDRLPAAGNGLVWHHTTGNVIKEQVGAWSPAEIGKAIELLEAWSQQGLFDNPDLTFGIITPLRKQVWQFKKAVAGLPWFSKVQARFTIGTAHSFQGSECDVLIYSPVVAENMDRRLARFTSSQRDLINVTVTRARVLLCVVGDIYACQKLPPDSPLQMLAVYAENLRKRATLPLNAAEKAMALILDELKLTYTAQHDMGGYRLDFVVNAASGERYNIEVDGDIHFGNEAIQHDARRDAYVKSQGLTVIRLAERDISNRPQSVKELLLRI